MSKAMIAVGLLLVAIYLLARNSPTAQLERKMEVCLKNFGITDDYTVLNYIEANELTKEEFEAMLNRCLSP